MDRICSEYFHLSISDWEIHSEELNRHGVDKAVDCNQLRLLQNILHFFLSVQISGFRWLHLTDALNYAIAMLQSPVQWQGVWSSAIFIILLYLHVYAVQHRWCVFVYLCICVVFTFLVAQHLMQVRTVASDLYLDQQSVLFHIRSGGSFL